MELGKHHPDLGKLVERLEQAPADPCCQMLQGSRWRLFKRYRRCFHSLSIVDGAGERVRCAWLRGDAHDQIHCVLPARLALGVAYAMKPV